MTPFFIISTPRARGSLLVRILDGTPGVRCAEENNQFLPKLMALHQMSEGRGVSVSPWPPKSLPSADWASSLAGTLAGWTGAGPEDNFTGVRNSFLGKENWLEAVGAWSRLQTIWPGARIIFLTRDDEETEISMFGTSSLWIPSYGSCHGNCLVKVREVRTSMVRYHEINPDSTLLLDANDVTDFTRLSAKLGSIGMPVSYESFSKEITVVSGDRKTLCAVLDTPKPAKTTPKPRNFRLPLVLRPAPKGLVVYTLRYGDADWLKECSASIDSWCRRHALQMKVWSEPNAAYPAEKFTVIDMIHDFLMSNAERMLFVDGDVFAHPAAPVPEFKDSGCYIMPDEEGSRSRKWPRWCKEVFGKKPPAGWVYRNSGVWSLDREAAVKLVEVISAPYHVFMKEQHQFNWWLALASQAKMPVHDLATAWNMLAKRRRKAWLFHLAGGRKLTRLENIRSRGHLPRAPQPFSQLVAPTNEFAIVYPWKKDAAEWEELRYSLRSVEKHFADKDCPIYILGTERPSWLEDGGRVKFVKAGAYLEALTLGLQLAKKVLWMNDDIALLKDLGWKDFEVALHRGDAMPKASEWFDEVDNAWRIAFSRGVIDLHHHGAEQVLDFATHTPYLFDYEKAMLTMERFYLDPKPSFETLYHTHHRSPIAELTWQKCSDLRCARALFLNFNDGTLSEELKSRVQARFPEMASWEKESDQPLPPFEIVVMGHEGCGFPHLAAIEKNNPGIPIHVCTGSPAAPGTKVEVWRAGDRRIRNWYLQNRDRDFSPFIVFVEYDVLANAPLRPVVLPDAGLVGRDVKSPESHWSWWPEVSRFPVEMQDKAAGIAPLAVVAMRLDFLEEVANPKWDDLFAADIFCELRIATLAKATGFAILASPALEEVRWQPIEHPGEKPGIWHPVKQ